MCRWCVDVSVGERDEGRRVASWVHYDARLCQPSTAEQRRHTGIYQHPQPGLSICWTALSVAGQVVHTAVVECGSAMSVLRCSALSVKLSWTAPSYRHLSTLSTRSVNAIHDRWLYTVCCWASRSHCSSGVWFCDECITTLGFVSQAQLNSAVIPAFINTLNHVCQCLTWQVIIHCLLVGKFRGGSSPEYLGGLAPPFTSPPFLVLFSCPFLPLPFSFPPTSPYPSFPSLPLEVGPLKYRWPLSAQF